MKGKLITVDGMDRAGKSTIATPYIAEWFKERGIPILQVADLNYTKYGKELREIFLSKEHAKTADITSLIMLSCSARRELIQSCIRPALDQGINVVCDRFTSTTYTFAPKAQQLKMLLDLSEDGTSPDHTIFMSINYPTYVKRLNGESDDQFESAEQDKFEYRLARYMEYFEMHAKRTQVSVVDATKPIDFVKRELDQILSHLFK